MGENIPDGEVFIYDTPPPLGALPGGRRGHQTHVHGWELPLRWDPLSRGRGLFLKQTLPEKTPGSPVHRPTSSL